jgi:glycosyltransferase involved in cell wall biosynthesis
MWKAKRLQSKWYPRFDAILCVAPEDLERTSGYINADTHLWLAPNGVDIDCFHPVPHPRAGKQNNHIVFVGSMDVAMNQDGAHWFVNSVFPIIQRRIPDAQFWVVGREPPPGIRRLAKRSGVRVTGTVEDVTEYFQRASVFVVPVRAGGGTKLKTLEAMSMGLPIVSTSVGAQGLDVEPGRHLHVADQPERFAGDVVELLEDRNKGLEMGREARRLVERRYNWTSIYGAVNEELERLLYEREKRQ